MTVSRRVGDVENRRLLGLLTQTLKAVPFNSQKSYPFKAVKSTRLLAPFGKTRIQGLTEMADFFCNGSMVSVRLVSQQAAQRR
jgi:hypothetical protein